MLHSLARRGLGLGLSGRRRHRSLMTASAAASTTAAAGAQQQQQQLALAREAREDAQWLARPTHARLLSPPTHARLAGDTRHQPVLSVENWLKRRSWSAAAEAADGDAIAAPGLRVLSHLLSYPLTLAHFLQHICPSPSQEEPIPLVVLGARAEATLPSLWWRELLCYHGGSHVNLRLHMVGPELPSSKGRGERVPLVVQQQEEEGHGQEQQQGGGGELTLFRHRGMYHELLGTDDTLPPKPAAFVAFNPGFGHPHLSEGWKPTLEAALGRDSPCSPLFLWTAHSEADKARDIQFLDRHFGQQQGVVDWLLAPMANPFASRKRVAGGVGEEKEAVVQANLHVGVFRVRRL